MVEVTKEQIDSWKEQYGYVYAVSIDGLKIYFKTLSRDDYMDIMQSQAIGDSIDPEVETVKRCILNTIDDKVFDKKGGYATVIYEQIMLKSGFVTIEAEEL